MGEYHINPSRSEEPIDDEERRGRARAILDRAEREQSERRASYMRTLDFSGKTDAS